MTYIEGDNNEGERSRSRSCPLYHKFMRGI